MPPDSWQTLLENLKNLGFLADWRANSVIPVLELVKGEDKYFLGPVLGKPAFAIHQNVALRFMGQNLSPQKEVDLKAIQGALTTALHQPVNWPKHIPHALRDTLPSLHPSDGEWFLQIQAPCLQFCQFCERALPNSRPLHTLQDHLDTLILHLENLEIPPGSSLTIGGAEPLAFENLPALLEVLKERELVVQSLHTAGWPLEDAVLDALKAAGLQRVRVPIYSALPEEHDKVVRAGGAFGKTIEALEKLKAQNISLNLHTLLLRDTLNTLPKTLEFLASFSPIAIEVAAPTQISDAPWLLHDYLPSADSVAKVLADFHPSDDHNLDFQVPLCALPNHLLPKAKKGPGRQMDAYGDASGQGRRETQGFYEKPCETCAQKAHCPGLSGPYGAIHSLESLRPF